jgi:hypothetical protein
MDPISVTASVAAISAACLRTAKTLNDLRSKYKDTNLTMASICSETTIIGTTLAKIQVILLNKPYILAPENHATPGVESLEIQPTFDIALAGCGEIYSFLEIEVQRLCNKTNDPPGWTEKAKYLWNEDRLKELLNHLRGHQSAITLLISVIQMWVHALCVQTELTCTVKLPPKSIELLWKKVILTSLKRPLFARGRYEPCIPSLRHHIQYLMGMGVGHRCSAANLLWSVPQYSNSMTKS